ncbi:hypothetical protein VF14_31875 [Nostoc linckia z18]|nr:hypothetical protein VF02_35490 [Nostoc linckia z1]PHJ73083.1 hypothetical protein VF06_36285 [Nostoc linckia z4]PHJ88758.1 hypothetical protein VF04_33095 [Nostoc linckia z7]PHK03090.1 hypothetical protein VF09_30520 [Nostoc linckia z9]PHK14520.1 hypothetical protein VF11_30600 [Nostoc linckia z14]PHK17306.1 hypothetical protein VF10_25855 [Nostoc linckia z13]PHK29246.1 hypothetical protein VF14_31875 [Nostoc linckia z18]PHK41187.1 hypothetical protein VF13_31730 [Nostoc linckia z16]
MKRHPHTHYKLPQLNHMAISISRAGKLITDANGFVSATLATLEVQDTQDEQGRERSQLQFIFKVPTTKGESDKYLWTGLNVNAEKTYYPVDSDGVVSSTPEYNKLTQLLLSLGLISVKQLDSNDEIELDLETLIGQKFEFKVIPNKLKPSLSDIDLKNIRLVKEQPSKSLTVGTSK